MTGHWWRLIVQLVILVSMLVVNALDGTTYAAAVSVSVIALPVASWTVFAILLWTEHEVSKTTLESIQSLHERVDDALTLAIISTVAGGIGILTLARIIGIITVPIGGLVTVALGFIVIEISLPALGFLQTWRNDWLPTLLQERKDAKEET